MLDCDQTVTMYQVPVSVPSWRPAPVGAHCETEEVISAVSLQTHIADNICSTTALFGVIRSALQHSSRRNSHNTRQKKV